MLRAETRRHGLDAKRNGTILGIIAVAAIVFGWDQTRELPFSYSYGAVPVLITSAWDSLLGGQLSLSAVGAITRLITALFLHGSVEHIVFNMVFLWTFGSLAAQILGQWRALAIFLLCGVCGNILQVWLNAGSSGPIIGASGAVCGFEGVYLGLAIRWRLAWPDVWPLAHPIPPLQLAAFGVVGFVVDMFMLTSHDQQIAYGAHIGGFLSGFAIAALITTVYPTETAYRRRA